MSDEQKNESTEPDEPQAEETVEEAPIAETEAEAPAVEQEAFILRFRHATGELENTARLGSAKRDIARLLTSARRRGIDVEKETKRI